MQRVHFGIFGWDVRVGDVEGFAFGIWEKKVTGYSGFEHCCYF